jgi:hypothetical protein
MAKAKAKSGTQQAKVKKVAEIATEKVVEVEEVAPAPEIVLKGNPEWSYQETEWFRNRSFAYIMAGWLNTRRKVDDKIVEEPRRYQLCFFKSARSPKALICAEYRNENDERCVKTFGEIEYAIRQTNIAECQAHPGATPYGVRDYKYTHLNIGHVFQSHATPLVKIQPMNYVVRQFVGALIKGKLNDPENRKVLFNFAPNSFMEKETKTKIHKLVTANRSKKSGSQMDGELLKVDVDMHRLEEADIVDAELAFERYDLFEAHVQESISIKHFQRKRQMQFDNFNTAKKLSAV